MKVSLNWLNQWVEIEDLDADELASRLTLAGLEVEEVERIGEGQEKIVVGRIDAIEEHPKADRLVVCQVDAGEGELRQIVCGAKNMKAGDFVPVALPGAEPPGIDFSIGARKVMGVPSAGMLCSEEELDLATESEGLMLLDRSLPVGTPIFEALGLKDVVLHIGLTPNRPDCLSHRGVAREVAALYGRVLRSERLLASAAAWEGSASDAIDGAAALEVVDGEGCPRYTAAVLEGVKVGPSPLWLRHRLVALGMRSVNNIVDVTNYVLMDLGQPLHAFDLDKIEGHQIIVRRASAGETIEAIDHKTYKLDEADLVIADGSRPVAIAGVMGGAESEVTEATTRILLECAYFDPRSVRVTAKRHGLHSESSHRYERGIDPGTIVDNLREAVALLLQAQAHLEGDAPVVRSGILNEGPGVKAAPAIALGKDRANQVLGTDIAPEEVLSYLKSVGVESVEDEGDSWRFSVPSYRPDLERGIDLVEEVARLHGFDKIEATLPRALMGHAHQLQKDAERGTIVSRAERRALNWVRDLLLSQGLREAVNYSFMGEGDLDRLRFEDDDSRRLAPRVANPLVQDQALMRTTLIPGLLNNLKVNRAQRRQDVAMFEVGRRYFMTEERRTLGVALTGRKRIHWSGETSWDFFDLKGMVEALGQAFDATDAKWSKPQVDEPYLHPGVQAVWTVGNQPVAFIGQLHPAIASKEGSEQPIFVAEVDLEALIDEGAPLRTFSASARFPAVVRDFALVADNEVAYARLQEAIEGLCGRDASFGELFESVALFDIYTGQPIPEGKRSLAIKVTYRAPDRTLTEAEIEAADNALLAAVEAQAGARLR
ncbi:phenylalanine--tRNA ligase subunit beta [Lujinxingia sediminis]|uniref:Phenylalanine--tRNA ligase beta subunit n=1 Tax=Lujinxingia sediminis TaxID=2480984 RepID=A0ABY0CX68_9DELT|nr:phenylalanine--tRNA ligase subunit beta [Lujinxingia sediminis]RVU48283.1 phenylalanine--tRNA ligase subunit beta [Lujinxingia sediminis]